MMLEREERKIKKEREKIADNQVDVRKREKK